MISGCDTGVCNSVYLVTITYYLKTVTHFIEHGTYLDTCFTKRLFTDRKTAVSYKKSIDLFIKKYITLLSKYETCRVATFNLRDILKIHKFVSKYRVYFKFITTKDEYKRMIHSSKVGKVEFTMELFWGTLSEDSINITVEKLQIDKHEYLKLIK